MICGCKLCMALGRQFILNGHYVCPNCDELLLDLEMELDETQNINPYDLNLKSNTKAA